MTSDDTFHIEIEDQAGKYKVIVEDDGRVGYAYLLANGTIVGEVWLYNRAPTPEKVNPQADELPLLNPGDYCDAEAHPLELATAELTCDWKRGAEELVEVLLRINGVLMARLTPGSKPGWSRYARRDGPLANVLPAATDLA